MTAASPIGQWQERLERHFESLARLREDSGLPLFALEHGLTGEQVAEVSALLRARLAAGSRLSAYWLLWAIHAAESGYGYTGDEYWRSFEEQTPGWQFRDRYRVAQWFSKFRDTYHGVTPSGPWAGHFRIIAWPITHAILPRDLQRQFARVLYDLRFHLANIDTADPATIGRLLAANAHHVTTRFEKFLQQEELTGRIVLALFDETPSEGEEPIYPPTLKRIIDDLERVRQAREWLKEARRVARDRFRGVASRASGRPVQASRSTPGVAASPSIRPSLFLRHVGSDEWSLGAEVPGFRGVAMLRPDIHAFLRRTRCRVNGASDPKPAGWLLSGPRKALLSSWPNPERPLIAFERTHAIVDDLLQAECRLTEGPTWLFRIAPDGTAREITGRIVRPGFDYIVLTTGALPDERDGVRACSVRCSGVKAFRISVPGEVSAEEMAWLDGHGLQVARTVRLWPAGLVARGWDGEGHTEWLTTESPCFGIVHDHPVDGYVVRLDHGEPQAIEAGAEGTPIFVRLPPLPRGTYSLEVKARRSKAIASVVKSPPAEGLVELRVRDPEPWRPGTVSHSGMVVGVDPYDADLEAFWSNSVRFSVLGPPSHRASFSVSLEAPDGTELLSERVDGPLDLPVRPESWQRQFGEFVQREKCAWRYIEASAGTLTINGGELGKYSRRFEREIAPVRWVLRRDNKRIVVRLVDESDREEGEQAAEYYSLERPLSAVALDPSNARSGVAVVAPGALFLARRDEYQDAIVVSTGRASGGLRGLGVSPSCEEIWAAAVPLARAIELFELWRRARLAGFLPDIRRGQIVEGILKAIYGRVGGPHWARAETEYLNDPTSARALETLKRGVFKHGGFAAVLRRDYEIVNKDAAEGAAWFGERAVRFGITTDRNLSEFALRLAGSPAGLPDIYGGELDGLVKQLVAESTLLRGARFVALLCANEGRQGSGRALPEWTW
jgi:hypothetical protein